MVDKASHSLQKYSTLVKLNPDDPEAHFGLAMAYEESNDYNEAYKGYEQCIRLNNRHARARLHIGFLFARADELSRAIDEWQKAWEIDSNVINFLKDPTSAVFYRRKIDESLNQFQRPILVSPDNAYAHYQLGLAYKFFDKPELALQSFKKAIDINPKLWEAYAKAGDVYSALNQNKYAITQYQKAVSVNPKYPDAYLNLGIIYEKENMIALSVKQYERALELDPDDSRIYYGLGRVYFKQGNFKLAIKAFQKSIDFDKNNPEVHFNLAKACEAIYRPDFAIMEYERSIELDPKYAEAYYQLGFLCLQMGETKKSIDSLENALKINPADPYAHYHLATAYSRSGNHEKAINHFYHAATLNPKDAYAFYNLGIEYIQTGNYSKAIDELKKALELSPNEASYYYHLAVAYSKGDDLDSALENLKKSIQLKPNEASTHFELANIYLKLKRIDDAVMEYRTVLEVDPKSMEAHYRLGLAFVEIGEGDYAFEEFQKALKSQPDHAPSLHGMGIIYLRFRNNVEVATDYLNQAIKADPAYAPALCDKGDALLSQGRISEAISNYERAYDISPGDKDIKIKFANALMRAGKVKEGTSMFHELINRDPENAEIRFMFGKAYEEISEINLAIEQYQRASALKTQDADYHIALARLYQRLEKLELAKQEYYNVIRITPDNIEAQDALAVLFGEKKVPAREEMPPIEILTEKEEVAAEPVRPEPVRPVAETAKPVEAVRAEPVVEERRLSSEAGKTDFSGDLMPSLDNEGLSFDLSAAMLPDLSESPGAVSADTAREERERAEREGAERERAEREGAERERAEREGAERERAEREGAERERAEREGAERERAERESAERERAERERAERERAERERAEREKAERERAEREREERERAEREKAERERAERDRVEREERERAERERAERDRVEREEREKAEREREEREKVERAEREKAERERAAMMLSAEECLDIPMLPESDFAYEDAEAEPVLSLEDGIGSYVRGDLVKAESVLGGIYEKNEDEYKAGYYLAVLMRQRQEMQKALKYLKKALNRAKNESDEEYLVLLACEMEILEEEMESHETPAVTPGFIKVEEPSVEKAEEPEEDVKTRELSAGAAEEKDVKTRELSLDDESEKDAKTRELSSAAVEEEAVKTPEKAASAVESDIETIVVDADDILVDLEEELSRELEDYDSPVASNEPEKAQGEILEEDETSYRTTVLSADLVKEALARREAAKREQEKKALEGESSQSSKEDDRKKPVFEEEVPLFDEDDILELIGEKIDSDDESGKTTEITDISLDETVDITISSGEEELPPIFEDDDGMVLHDTPAVGAELIPSAGIATQPASAVQSYETQLQIKEEMQAGLEAFSKKNEASAESHFVKVLSIDAQNVKALEKLSEIYLGRNDEAKAAPLIDRLLAVNAESYNPCLKLIQAYEKMGEKGKAKEIASRLSNVRTSDSGAHREIAETLLSLDLIEGAAQHYKRAMKIAPNNLEYPLKLAELYEKNGKSALAALQYQRLISRNRSSELYFKLADLYHALKNNDGEKRILKSALKNEYSNIDMIVRYFSALQEVHEKEEAGREFFEMLRSADLSGDKKASLLERKADMEKAIGLPLPADLIAEEKKEPEAAEPAIEKREEAPVIIEDEMELTDRDSSLLITLGDDDIIILEDEAPDITEIDSVVEAPQQKEEVPEFEIPMLLEIADEIFAGEEPSSDADSRDDEDSSEGGDEDESDRRRKRKKKKKRRSI